MSLYLVDFGWTKAPPENELRRRLVMADSADGARLEAALLFAAGDFKGDPPQSYRLLDEYGDEIYRFPP